MDGQNDWIEDRTGWMDDGYGIWIDRWMDRTIDGGMIDRWIDGWMDGQNDRWMDGSVRNTSVTVTFPI